MPGRFRYVPYGAPAFDALVETVRRRQTVHRLAPLTVVVPTRRAGRALRHRLARTAAEGSSGVGNVRFVTLADVAEELGGARCRRDGRRKVTRSSLGAAARVALREQPGFLRAVADHPSTEAELVSLYEELRQVGDDAVETLSNRGRHGHDLASICTSIRARLEPVTFDDTDLADAAVAGLSELDSLDVIGTHIVVHLPERARPGEIRLLAALGAAGELTVHLGTVGDAAADPPIHRIGDSLAAAGLVAEEDTASPMAQRLGFDQPVEVGEHLVARDAQGEVNAAVRVVLESLEAGVAPDQIAVLYSSRQTYLGLLAVAFEQAGLAWSGPTATRVADTAIARALSGLVSLATDALSRAGVMEWIRSAPLRDADGAPVPLGSWDLVSRLAGIVSGDVADWKRHLDALSSELRRLVGDDDASRVAVLAPSERLRRDRAAEQLAACAGLERFIAALGARCARAMATTSWEERVAWCRESLGEYLGSSGRLASDPSGTLDASVDRVLEELATLDGLGDRADLDVFSRALAGALERATSYEGSLSRGIAVGHVASGAALALDVVVVLGGVEGELPARAKSSPLVSSAEREALGLDAATPSAVAERDRRFLLAATAGVDRVVATWRERDAADGRARIRSRFLGDMPPATLVPSPVGSMRAVAEGTLPAIGRAELVAATLLSVREAGGNPQRSPLVSATEQIASGVEVSASRARHSFDRFSGQVGDGTALDEAFAAGLAPTTLETYAVCPFKYFLSRELRCEVVEAPERRATIDPRDRGSIAHEILERLVAGIAADDPQADSAERLVAIAEDVFGRYERLGRTGAPALWVRRRRHLLLALERERQRDTERRRVEGSVPLALEWPFGGESGPAVGIEAGGRKLVFRGKVDRIDRNQGGALSVIDYKTGGDSSYAGLDDDPVDAGRHLQLAVYALAARAGPADGDTLVPIRSSYRFLDTENEITLDLDEGLVERATEVLSVIADGVEAGWFPFRPGELDRGSFEHCRWCDFDSVCPTDRDDFWQSARDDERLADYVALVEPEDADV